MKKKWIIGLRITASLCAAFGWWGLLYPELALTPDTVEIRVEDEDGNLRPIPGQWSFDSGLYLELLAAEPDQITFRSRLLTNLKLVLEAFYDKN